jgi:hypothetical protein
MLAAHVSTVCKSVVCSAQTTWSILNACAFTQLIALLLLCAMHSLLTQQADPGDPSCDSITSFFDASFPDCATSKNAAFTDMKDCFIGFVSGAADLTCDAAPAAKFDDTTADKTDKNTADTTADDTAPTGGKRARKLQDTDGTDGTDPPTADEAEPATERVQTEPATDATDAATAEEQQPGVSPVESKFFDTCSQQISDCGAAPACRDCVSAAVNVSCDTLQLLTLRHCVQ